MSTNAAGSNAPSSLDKTVNSVMEGLGLLYKECHQSDPSGQACEAVKQIMQAVSEVAGSLASQQFQAPPLDPFAAASQNVNGQMMNEAQAQPPMGEPSPY